MSHHLEMDGVEYIRRRALISTFAVMLVMLVGWAIFGPGPPPPSLADGTYVSRCCGEISFKTGTLFVGEEAIPYKLEGTNLGLVAIPDSYVGVADGKRVIVERSRHVMMLRFDRSKAPVRSVTIWDVDRSQKYVFEKR